MMTEPLARQLTAALARHGPLAIAVSGGVDSMTLAVVAHRAFPGAVTTMHAVSPAVPAEATARVQRHAKAEGWPLTILDAGELRDQRYTANPVNRCYFCKTNLYSRIAEHTEARIASGTNCDDLSDFRPGLQAATEHRVVHPFVEAGFGKADIYALARALDLTDLAALPAQPCLASRIETGLPVAAPTLAFVEATERAARALMPMAHDLRCRVTADGVAVEAAPLPAGPGLNAAEAGLRGPITAAGYAFLGVRPYRRGSAFLRDGAQ